MKRRLEIARGLMHKPKVLFLDEPTLGLDAQTRRHIWEYIKKLNKEENVTIILTTHYMEEADYLCERVAIIDYGKIIALDTPENLKDLLGGDVVSMEVEGDLDVLTTHLKSVEWIKTMKKHESNLSLTMEHGEKRIPELINIAQKNNVTVTSVNLHKPSLEDVFIYFTGKTIRGADASPQEISRERMQRHGGH
jgi:ABC-2 type transport system ATP-binding protein